MLIVFEVLIRPGTDTSDLLTDEILKETNAQVMTLEEAARVGFTGIAPDPKGRETRLIAVAPRDAQWVHRRLEGHDYVLSYRVHEVG